MSSPSGGQVPRDLSMRQLQPNDPKYQGVGDGRNPPPGSHLADSTGAFLPGAEFTASPLEDKDVGARGIRGPTPEEYNNFSPSTSPSSFTGKLGYNGIMSDDSHPAGHSIDSFPSPVTSTEDQGFPSVVGGGGLGFDGVNLDSLDDSMAGILDPSASSSNFGTCAAAGVNIAPWEMEEMHSTAPPQPASAAQAPFADFPEPPGPFDSTASSSEWDTALTPEAISQSQYERKQSHFPRFLRGHSHSHKDDDDGSSFQHYSMGSGSGTSLRSSSATSLLADGAQTPTNNRPRSTKGNSARNPSPPPAQQRHTSVMTTGGHGHGEPHHSRFSRFGSVASGMSSNSSINSESSGKKKGGFLGFIKRKTGHSTSGPASSVPDYPQGTRRVTGPSRMSVSTTASSLRKESIGSNRSTGSGWSSGNTPPSMSGRLPSFKSEGGISPLHEDSEPESEPVSALGGFKLDTNFDDMDDIVDSNLAGVRPHPHMSTTHLGGSSGPGGDSHLSPGGGDGTISGLPRNVPESNNGAGQFTRPDPFGSSPKSATGSQEGTSPTSMSTSLFDVSPKHSIPGSTAPRRPSQLRNFKINSIDSEASDVSSAGPIAPSWAEGMTGDPTIFNDPFGARQGSIASIGDGRAPPMSPGSMVGMDHAGSISGSFLGAAPAISPFAGLAAAAAWAAPESWGVEGDEDEDDDDSASSSGTEGEWAHDGDRVLTPTVEDVPGEESGDPGTSPHKLRQMSLWPLSRRVGGHAEDKGPLVSW